MSKTTCILKKKDADGFSANLTVGKEYVYTKQQIPKSDKFGYIVVNDEDPATPIRLKEETFKDYFGPAPKKEVPETKTEKEKEAEEMKVAQSQLSAGLKGPSEKAAVENKTTVKRVVVFDGIQEIENHKDLIKNIILTPQGKFFQVTVNLQNELSFSSSGSAIKIMEEFPAMLQGIFSLEKKIEALSKIIDERIQIEQVKKEEAKKETEKAKTSKASEPKVSTKKAATKEEAPKSEAKKEPAKQTEMFEEGNKGDEPEEAEVVEEATNDTQEETTENQEDNAENMEQWT